MKKFLSLVLALVMTMSLVTVSAGAKDFTDSSKINYEEAVAVMSELGVVGGYADGTFNPSATLTRGAAAKIICNVILGTTTADALVADAAPFSDVPTDNVFAGYIAYCAKEGIISGYADGTFRPANTLTGYAFMKMLLGALGLDSDVEGYTGANWSIAVAKRALSDSVDLTDGLVGEFNGTKAVTREEACLYAFNMIKAAKFSYPTSSTITVGDVTVKNNSVASQEPVGANYAGAYFKTVYSKLTANTNASDCFNRPATEWKYDGTKIGKFAQTPDATYTVAVEGGDLYDDLALSANVTKSNVDEYINGADAVNTKSIKKNDDDTKFGGNGVLTEAYLVKNSKGEVTGVKVVEIETFVNEITRVTENDDDERIVKIGSKEYVTEDFAEDDIVVYTEDVSATAKDEKIQSMFKPEKMTGELTKIKGSYAELTIDGTVYKASKNGEFNSVSAGDDVDFYLDAYGYVIYVEETEENFNADNAAYVLKTGDSVRGEDWAKLLFADGTTKTVDLYKNYKSDAVKAYDKDTNGDGNYENLADGDVVSYSAQDNGTYKLTYKGGTEDDEAISKKNPNAAGVATDSKTLFVYYLDDGDTVKTYTGYKSVKNISDAEVGVYAKDGKNATVVFVIGDSTKLSGSATDRTVIAYKSSTKMESEKDDVVYYTVNAIDNGVKTTIKIDADDWNNLGTDAGKNKFAAYSSMSYDKDDLATTGTLVTWEGTKRQITVEYSNDMLKLNGTNYSYTDDVVVIEVEDDGSDLNVIEVADIMKDNNDSHDPYYKVFFTLDDGEVDFIVLVKNA